MDVTNEITFADAVARNAETARITKAILALNSITLDDSNVDYKPLYLFLFNGITDILDMLRGMESPEAVPSLMKLHCDSEDLFIELAERAHEVIPMSTNKP